MKAKELLIIICVALAASSCATTTRTSTAKRMDIYGSGVIQYPVIAELEVRETKVSGRHQTSSTQILNSARNHAVADAIKQANADVLIEPVFESETSGGITTVTVTGFPGFYTKFRPIEFDDLPMLEAGVSQQAAVFEPQESNSTKSKAAVFEPQESSSTKSNAGAILLSVAVAVGLALLFPVLL